MNVPTHRALSSFRFVQSAAKCIRKNLIEQSRLIDQSRSPLKSPFLFLRPDSSSSESPEDDSYCKHAKYKHNERVKLDYTPLEPKERKNCKQRWKKNGPFSRWLVQIGHLIYKCDTQHIKSRSDTSILFVTDPALLLWCSFTRTVCEATSVGLTRESCVIYNGHKN